MANDKHAATPTPNKRFAKAPWDAIEGPGSYVSCDTGHLIRVPPAAFAEGSSPSIEILGPDGGERVLCLSNNPYEPVEKLRLLAADADVAPCF
jgi:hypothetical protein